MSAIGPAERAVLLAFADDEHLMGQRHTEWIGVAPFLEEDLAFSSIAQDELGHAVLLYELVLGDEGVADVDELAFGRTAAQYRSSWLVEQPCTDWAEALIRHWLYDLAEQVRWEALATSSNAAIAAVARRALAEEQYHRRHADALLEAIAGDAEATRRIGQALEMLLPLAAEMFETVDAGDGADEAVVGRSGPALRADWQSLVSQQMAVADWVTTLERMPASAGRTVRSEHFDEVYARMREVVTLDPTATW
jgi:ring-1,2-phenylacetyl-CoA epoxidase subunit PaaC